MKSENLQAGRLRLCREFEWPARFRRVPAHKRRNVGCPRMDQAIEEIVSSLDFAQIGFAELSLGKASDPGAVLRFEWRGRRLVTASDVFVRQSANVHSLRASINVLTTLALDGQADILRTLLGRMADQSDRSLSNLIIRPEEAFDLAETEWAALSDALLEAAVSISRGERSGALQTGVFDILVTWSTANRLVRLVVETPPGSPQGLTLAQAGLELEEWIASVKVSQVLDSSRWIFRTSKHNLECAAAKQWMSLHTTLRERRPELLRWLLESVR
jgi:hypothetical protein